MESTEERNRAKVGKLAGIVGIICNFALAGGKFVVGTLVSSMSIIADSVNNLSDAASSIVTLLGFKLAEKPADKKHPFGHARFEYLASLTVAVMIFVIGFELAKSSVEKIISPTPVKFSLVTIIVLVVSILVKLWMTLFYKKKGKQIHSTTLLATSADSRNDVLTTTCVLIAMVVELLTKWQIDGIMGALVSLFILYNGIGLIRQTISPLLGEEATPEFRKEIIDFVNSYDKVLGCHDLMIHDYGPAKRYATIHVEVDKDEDPMNCHDTIDRIERQCLKKFGIHMVVHYDPIVTDDLKTEKLQLKIMECLKSKDSRLSIHDFRIANCSSGTLLVFDLVLPEDMMSQGNQIKDYILHSINKGKSKYLLDVTFDIDTND